VTTSHDDNDARRTVSLALELELEGDALSGRLAGPAGRERRFCGRLGLLAAVDALLAPALGPTPTRPRRNPMTTTTTTAPFERLRTRLDGELVTPDDPRWEAARQPFNLVADQRPAAVANVAGEDDVVEVVRFAAANGLRVAPQSTGHNAVPIGWEDETILLRTTNMRRAIVDPVARRARVRAGARWGDVTPAASAHGLAPLHGSSPGVGIAGYTLGGGLSFYGRRHGLAANSVVAIDVVTADGELVHASADSEPDLFWALRGGGGSFGVVTGIEFELYPVEDLYAGVLFFPWERAGEVLEAWRGITADAPDELTTVGRIMQFPPFEEIPEPMRGRAFALVEAIYLGSEADGADLLAPVRALGPEIDTLAAVEPAAIGMLHMDPQDPVPGASSHALLGDLPADAVERLVEVAGPGSGSTLISVEVRHTGGALARRAEGAGALAALPGEYATFAVGLAGDEASAAATTEQAARVADALAPWDAGRYLNFTEQPVDAAGFYDAATLERLRRIRAERDPAGTFLSNHPVDAGR
jgi:FAD/FMN-containing dehydrogenase